MYVPKPEAGCNSRKPHRSQGGMCLDRITTTWTLQYVALLGTVGHLMPIPNLSLVGQVVLDQVYNLNVELKKTTGTAKEIALFVSNSNSA